MDSDKQVENKNELTIDSKDELTDSQSSSINVVEKLISGWKWKLPVLVVLICTSIFFFFYGQHFMAVKSMNAWANDVSGKPVNCVFRDTDSNGYISCTAMVNEKLVPLECGTNIFNLGCRVNYSGGVSSHLLK